MRNCLRLLVLLCPCTILCSPLAAQSATGAIDISARITPTGARPEPVRQFTLYVLTKSYADILREVETQEVLPSRDKFVDTLKCSPELRKWIKAHEIMDLTSPDLDKLLTTDDIMNIPEFFGAYQRSNSGGVTVGLPKPKYRPSDMASNPEKFQKQKVEYLSATRKFIETHPSTVQGMELELAGVNPNVQWEQIQVDHRKRVAQLAPDTAQVKYLAGRADTDLDGRALISGLRAGDYWVSTVGIDAASGDRRLLWDVPVKVQTGQTTHVELTNLNATDARGSSAR